MDGTAIRKRLAESAVARLATVGLKGKPHLVPITFVLAGDVLYFAVDAKRKRTTDLQRLRNIAANPAVAVLADHYEEDWTRLWWVRVDGAAQILGPGAEAERAVDLLVHKYRQYARARPAGPVVAIKAERMSGWSAS